MSSLSEKEIEALVSRTLESWYREVYSKLKAAMDSRGLVLTGSLQSSLSADIHAAAGDIKGQLKLYFEDYGRFQDMKHRYTGKMPPISVMLEYVRKIGIDKFKYVPGYPVGVFPVGTTKSKYGSGNRIAENRIAWGLAMSRVAPKNAGRTYGKKKWYAKTFYSSIDSLIVALLEKTAVLAKTEIKDSLTNKQ
jgi:hypothetical protein